MSKVSFDTSQNSFFNIIKKRADHYFAENNLHTAGNGKLYIKSMIQVLSALTLYVVLVFFTPPAGVALLLCGVMGFNLAIIGFNIMHEGGHQSFSRYLWLNNVAAYFLNVLGGNSYFWKVKHNINHHTYTNIEGLDSDIDVRPFMRLHESQPRYWFHRFQHFYWIFLYGISYVVWVFYEDFLKYFTKKIAVHMNPQPLKRREHVIFWLTKVLYIGVYIILPALVVGWGEALVGYIVVTFVCGLTTSIVFQLAHVVEGTTFASSDVESGKIKQVWAIHQVSSTSNFATKDKVLFWLLGGLNFQVEHHLFPRISHIHYPQINHFVKEACKEYNVIYNEHTTMLKAFVSHLLYLRRLGNA